MSKFFYNRKGFTLIELLVVVAIIGILAAIVMVSLTSARSKARDAQRIEDAKTISGALELYFSNNGAYPDQPAGACVGQPAVYNNVSTLTSSLVPNYLQVIPHDPNPRSCVYNYDYCTAGPAGAAHDYTVLMNMENTQSFWNASSKTDNWCVAATTGSDACGYAAVYSPCVAQ